MKDLDFETLPSGKVQTIGTKIQNILGMKAQAKTLIANLLRGVSTDHLQIVRDAWRELLELGDPVVDAVRVKLGSSIWEECPGGPISKYLGVLLSIRDELESSRKLHPIRRLLKPLQASEHSYALAGVKKAGVSRALWLST